jgi:hypothetical protein
MFLQLIIGRLLQFAASEWGKDILFCSSALKQKQKPFSQQYGRRVYQFKGLSVPLYGARFMGLRAN